MKEYGDYDDDTPKKRKKGMKIIVMITRIT